MNFRSFLLLLVLGLGVTSVGFSAGNAAVADAAERGNLEQVRELLRGGADVAFAQGDGMTALHWAAMRGDAEIATMLIFSGADLEAGTRVGLYRPLHMATQRARHEVVKVLLEAGADVEPATQSGGATPLHFAAQSGDVISLGLLVEHGAEVNVGDSAWLQTPLLYAAAADRTGAVDFLLESGADVESASKVVWVPEQAAAERAARRLRAKRRQALKALEEELPSESSSSEGSEKQGEPVGEGEQEEDPELRSAKVELAKEPGKAKGPLEAEGPGTEGPGKAGAASPTQISAEEEWKLDEVEGEEEEFAPKYQDLVGGHGGLTALHLAAREGHQGAALRLLEGGARIDRQSGGDQTSPLMFAIINGHFDLALELLSRGADVGVLTAAGAGPLHATLNTRWAPKASYPQPGAYKQQKASHLELLWALLEEGADPNARLTKHLWYASYNFEQLEDMTGATPFWRAAYAADLEAMKLLHEYGADPTISTTKLPPRRRVDPSLQSDVEGATDLSGVPPVEAGGPHLTPLHAASGAGYGERFSGHAHQHVPDGWMPAVRFLVEEMGVDVNTRDHKAFSPLHNAAARGDDEMVLYLLMRGADAMAVTRKGQTTADMANGPVQRVRPYESTLTLLESLGVPNNHNCLSC